MSQLNRLKSSNSQTKIKTKIPQPSPSNKKSLTKTKDKSDRLSPRANRIHILEIKKEIEIPKKHKIAL
jgi:hypothetical protein